MKKALQIPHLRAVESISKRPVVRGLFGTSCEACRGRPGDEGAELLADGVRPGGDGLAHACVRSEPPQFALHVVTERFDRAPPQERPRAAGRARPAAWPRRSR